MRRTSIAMSLVGVLAGSAVLADAPVAIHLITKRDGSLAAATQGLTNALNKAFSDDQRSEPTWSCEQGLMTNIAVGWKCVSPRIETVGHDHFTRAFAIDAAGNLTPITMEKLFKPGAAAALADKGTHEEQPCKPALDGDFMMTYEGLDLFGDGNSTGYGCVVAWKDALPYLLPPFDRIATYVLTNDGNDGEPAIGKTAAKRFVADPVDADAVRDTQTGLEWAAHDNGADVDYDAAAAFAKAYRGGGHADWRLPTADELNAIDTPDLAHREPKDCTGGKSSYVITPLIHVSCGLAWSSTADGTGMTALGFISGTPRVVKRTEKKNYRALVVRKGS